MKILISIILEIVLCVSALLIVASAKSTMALAFENDNHHRKGQRHFRPPRHGHQSRGDRNDYKFCK